MVPETEVSVCPVHASDAMSLQTMACCRHVAVVKCYAHSMHVIVAA